MSFLIPLLGSLLGGGLVATIVTHYLSFSKEQIFFMRKKAEELYVAFERFDRSLTSYFLPAYDLLKGKITENQFQDIAVKNSNTAIADASIQMQMIIDVYFPLLKDSFEKYSKVREELNALIPTTGSSAFDAIFKEERLKRFDDAMGKLDTQANILKQAIIMQAQKFTAPSRSWFSIGR